MIIPIEIIERCKKNDPVAQRKLYNILLPYLGAVCRRYLWNTQEINDVLQETFIRLFSHIESYNQEKGELKTWASKIAVNCCLKENAKGQRFSADEFSINKHDEQIDLNIVEKLNIEDILQFLKKMPPQYYVVFNMHIIDGYSHKEIADSLDIDENLSRKRLSRGRAWLKKKIGNQEALKHFFE